MGRGGGSDLDFSRKTLALDFEDRNPPPPHHHHPTGIVTSHGGQWDCLVLVLYRLRCILEGYRLARFCQNENLFLFGPIFVNLFLSEEGWQFFLVMR